jgi:hypothetical protein
MSKKKVNKDEMMGRGGRAGDIQSPVVDRMMGQSIGEGTYLERWGKERRRSARQARKKRRRGGGRRETSGRASACG